MQRFGHRKSSLTFSLVLHESTNVVTLLYDNLYAPAASPGVVSGVRAAKGLQAPGGFAFVQNTGAVSLTQQLSFMPLP